MTAGLSRKAQLIARDIEASRIAGRWTEIPELARRYLKHNPAGAALYHAILAEYQAYTFLSSLNEVEIYADDAPERISAPTGMTVPVRDEFQSHVQQAKQRAVDEAERQDAAVLYALFQCFTGDYVEALETLNDAQWPPVSENDMPLSVEGYRFVLVVQAWVIKGICQEATQMSADSAIDSFLKARQLFKEYSGERGDSLVWLIEETLYRLPLFYLRNGDRTRAIESFREYRDYCVGWPQEFRPAKRLVLCRHCIPLISTAYSEGDYIPCVPTFLNNTAGANDTPAIQAPLTFRQEIIQLHEIYEDAVHRCSKFPRSGQLNQLPLEMADRIVFDWKLIGAATRGERRAIMLYRATELTFQSPAIMRHLINALIALGEYEEAELALESYADLVTKRGNIVSAHDMGVQQDTATSERQGSKGSLVAKTMPFVREDAEHPQKAVETLLVGARLKLTDLGKPKDGVKFAELAIRLCEESENVVEAYTHSIAWQLTGVGYGLMAREANQHELRPALYEQAISALTEAISRNPENAEAHYHLALQHADGRNLAQSLVSVKQSLQLDPSRVRAWHLLALLMSANKDIEGALRICSIGVETSEWEVQPDGTGERQGQAGEGEDVLALMVTRTALEELLHGPKEALAHLNTLFTLYGRVFAGEGGGSAASEMNSTVRRDNDTQPAGGGSTRIARSLASHPARRAGASLSATTPSRSGRLDVPMGSYAGSVINGGGSGSRVAPTVASSRSSYSLASRVTTRVRLRRQRALKALTELWLLSASAFRRLGRLEDARQAVEEAEGADSESAAVSCQAGLLLLEQGKTEDALTAFSKAVFLEPHHVQATVLLARANMLLNRSPLAEGLLRTTTRSRGWNNADAWYYLGNVYRQTDRADRAKECFWYALDLESTRPARAFYTLLP
ncbi:hypothetical protein THASP1DRAFT_30806 [Thamnocephalis sphaerospora]|uniref:Tetratricopeptide repeat protein 7 N-terminal domain-containing protein n=1 Tax=Thamnocephalis sphaerospora TaxID=78915 RepID=A0A4P9XPL7_9FUNG|nr:hypothetical protein THASP1DRAFT_30806 [Thamnocephalis sphaerospora]|eukprot:RKP07381.1 hypothetical protein THASP1DRAFT_30806 [Thamnocephalis sphaerospora]